MALAPVEGMRSSANRVGQTMKYDCGMGIPRIALYSPKKAAFSKDELKFRVSGKSGFRANGWHALVGPMSRPKNNILA